MAEGREMKSQERSARPSSSLRLFAVLSAAILALSALLPIEAAKAQQRPRTIVEMLFGGGNRMNEAPSQQRVKKRVIRRQGASSRAKPARTRSTSRATPQRSRAPAAAVATSAPTVDKDENAKTVLVVGDFLADGLADGLEDTYSDNSMVRVTARTNGSSGLVREDFYDWSQELGPILDEVDPAAVVMMIGSNDRQPMTVSGTTLSVRSNGWTAEYEKRATDIANIAKEKNTPIVWVGMPSFKYDSMNEDMVFFNDIYRRAVERVSGNYVDIWEGFVDEKGDFVYSGPDVNGQTTRLRGSDGLRMTDAGKEKLAFFTEKALTRVLGNVTPEVALGDEALPKMQLPPLANAASARTAPPVSMSDPKFDGGDNLLGTGSAASFALDLSPRDRLVLQGDVSGQREGRADNFAWTEKTAAVRAEAPIAYRGTLDLGRVKAESGIKPPAEMPSIIDAIIEDWAASDTAEGGSPSPSDDASPPNAAAQ